MMNLYLIHYDRDCGDVALTLGQRLRTLYPTYQVFWPIPRLESVAARQAILRRIDQAIICIGPAWEHVMTPTHIRRIEDPQDEICSDLQYAILHIPASVIVLVDREALPPPKTLPLALRGIYQLAQIPWHRSRDVTTLAIRVHFTLSH